MPVQTPPKPGAVLNDMVPSAGSTSVSIVDSIPLSLVLWMASPYLAGKTLDDAVKLSVKLWKENRFASTIDILGEDCTAEEDCEQFVRAYIAAADAVSANQPGNVRDQEKTTISFKPSMFSTTVPGSGMTESDRQKAYARIKTIVSHAKERGVRMTLEAEDHRWTDFQLDTYFALLDEGFDNLGTVLQARLFRTKDDIKRFDQRCRVRLVIGIYNEPADIALTQKPEMKERLVDYAAELAARGAYIELATHDEDCVRNFIKRVALPQKVGSDRFETQWLLGVPRKEVQYALASGQYVKQLSDEVPSSSLEFLADLSRQGVLVRMYLPFGADAVAGPYCKRRLKANPHMISYGIKNLLNLR